MYQSTHVEEEVGVLGDDETDRAEGLGPERDGGRLGRLEDLLQERRVHRSEGLRAREARCNAVHSRLAANSTEVAGLAGANGTT